MYISKYTHTYIIYIYIYIYIYLNDGQVDKHIDRHVGVLVYI